MKKTTVTKEARLFKAVVLLLLAAFSILTIPACEKEDTESYEVRKKEHRLFRCKIDDKEWTYTGEEYWDLYPHIRSGYYEKDSSIIIRAIHNSEPENENAVSMNIFTQNGLKVGDNNLTKDTQIRGLNGKGTLIEIETDYDQNNFYIQDVDTINHIIKGAFQFKTKSYNSEKIIFITDGEFDLKISTWLKK